MAQASRAPSLKFLFRIYQSPPKYFPTDTELSTQVHEPNTKIWQNTDLSTKDSSVLSARHGMFAQQTLKSALWWQWHWQWWSIYDINDDDETFQARLGCVITPRNPPPTTLDPGADPMFYPADFAPHLGECFSTRWMFFSSWWMFFNMVNVFHHGECWLNERSQIWIFLCHTRSNS